MFGIFKSKNKPLEFTISNQTILRILGIALLTYVFLIAVRQAQHALTLIFVALFLALALNTPVHWLAQRIPGKRRGSRSLATALSFLLIIGLLLGFIASIVPPLVRQTSTFINKAPSLISDLRSEDTSLGRFVRRYNLQPQVKKFSSQLSDRLKGFTGTAVNTFGRVTSSIFSVLTVLVLTFMMLIEGPRWRRFILKIIPDDKEPRVRLLAKDMGKVIRGYVNGQVVLAAMASIFIVIPLIILNVSYPVALMVLVFFCGLIPLVGHTIGAIIVSTVALFQSPVAAIIILAYYISYQQIENYIIQPRVQANTTNMSPLLVFSSVIIGISFSGLLGGLVAIPIAGCLRIFLLDYLNRQKILTADDVPAVAIVDTGK